MFTWFKRFWAKLTTPDYISPPATDEEIKQCAEELIEKLGGAIKPDLKKFDNKSLYEATNVIHSVTMSDIAFFAKLQLTLAIESFRENNLPTFALEQILARYQDLSKPAISSNAMEPRGDRGISGREIIKVLESVSDIPPMGDSQYIVNKDLWVYSGSYYFNVGNVIPRTDVSAIYNPHSITSVQVAASASLRRGGHRQEASHASRSSSDTTADGVFMGYMLANALHSDASARSSSDLSALYDSEDTRRTSAALDPTPSSRSSYRDYDSSPSSSSYSSSDSSSSYSSSSSDSGSSSSSFD